MDGIDTVRHILCLCKAVFITNERITLGFLCVAKEPADLRYTSKLRLFGCFNLRFAIVRMFDNGDIALDDLFRYIICGTDYLSGSAPTYEIVLSANIPRT